MTPTLLISHIDCFDCYSDFDGTWEAKYLLLLLNIATKAIRWWHPFLKNATNSDCKVSFLSGLNVLSFRLSFYLEEKLVYSSKYRYRYNG